jgi:hypothetical protein
MARARAGNGNLCRAAAFLGRDATKSPASGRENYTDMHGVL